MTAAPRPSSFFRTAAFFKGGIAGLCRKARPSIIFSIFMVSLPCLPACDGQVFMPPSKSQDALQPGSHPTPIRNSAEGGQSGARPQSNPDSAVVQKRLSELDVFFVAHHELTLYEEADLSKGLCQLKFGDQLLIRERQADTLKLRLDLFAHNERQCPPSAQYAYVHAQNLIEPPPPPGDDIVLDEESVPVFSDSLSVHPACHLNRGSKLSVKLRRGLTYTQVVVPAEACAGTFEGLGVIRDLDLLPFNERYHRYPHLRALTLARDVSIRRLSDPAAEVVCKLARGNFILESTRNTALQMPATANCPSDMLTGYFKHSVGMWLEELPPEAP